MLVIGIAGPPAGGKSTVASILAEHGAAWINADRLAHAALRLQEVQAKLRSYFGASIFHQNAGINRKELAKIVFGDDPASTQSLQYLESVIHPIVLELAIRRLDRLSRSGVVRVTVLDAPLLIEAGWHFHCDELWYVDSPRELRTQWAALRSWTEDHLKQRESRQLPAKEKRRHATHTIENSGQLQKIRTQIDSHMRRIGNALNNREASSS